MRKWWKKTQAWILEKLGADDVGLLVGTPVDATTTFTGVPEPYLSNANLTGFTKFDYNPYTVTFTEPAEWPAAESTGHYYVDSTDGAATDSGNTYGYPNKPRVTFPTTLTAGQSVTMGDGTYTGNKSFSVSGTQANPCWFRQASGKTATIQLNMELGKTATVSHFIVDGITFGGDTGKIDVRDTYAVTYLTVRNTTKTGSATLDVGASHAISGVSHFVYYNNQVSYVGDSEDMATSNDRHAIKIDSASIFCWVIGNDHHHTQGDSIQVGDPLSPWDSTDPSYVFIAGNTFHDDRENAVDLKTCKHVIISENTLYGYETSASSSGAAIVIHDGGEDCWIINNLIHTADEGIYITTWTDYWIVGNVIRDINSDGDISASPYGAVNGFGIDCEGGSGTGTIENNTFHTCPSASVRIKATSVSNSTFQNNIVGTGREANNYELLIESATALGQWTTINYNLYQASPRFRLAADVDTTIAGWRTTTSDEANSDAAAAAFTNEAGDDFRLQASSPARNNGAVPGYVATFSSTYGLDVSKDIAGILRPQGGTWDIGAYEG